MPIDTTQSDGFDVVASARDRRGLACEPRVEPLALPRGPIHQPVERLVSYPEGEDAGG
jgi:hypothetical protein